MSWVLADSCRGPNWDPLERVYATPPPAALKPGAGPAPPASLGHMASQRFGQAAAIAVLSLALTSAAFGTLAGHPKPAGMTAGPRTALAASAVPRPVGVDP